MTSFVFMVDEFKSVAKLQKSFYMCKKNCIYFRFSGILISFGDF